MAKDLQLTARVIQDGVSKHLQGMIQRFPESGAAGAYALGNAVMTSAKRRTPVKTGVLRASGYVVPPATTGTTSKVTLGFGGAARAYAVIQHERTDFRHPNGGEAKFLANAIAEFAGAKGIAVFANAVREYLRRRTKPGAEHQDSPRGGTKKMRSGRKARR